MEAISGVSVSRSTMCRAIARLGKTHKKKNEKTPSEQVPESHLAGHGDPEITPAVVFVTRWGQLGEKFPPVHARSSHACTIRHHERRDSEDELLLFYAPLYTLVRGRRILRTSHVRSSRRFALRVDLFLYYRLCWLRGGYRVFV